MPFYCTHLQRCFCLVTFVRPKPVRTCRNANATDHPQEQGPGHACPSGRCEELVKTNGCARLEEAIEDHIAPYNLGLEFCLQKCGFGMFSKPKTDLLGFLLQLLQFINLHGQKHSIRVRHPLNVHPVPGFGFSDCEWRHFQGEGKKLWVT